MQIEVSPVRELRDIVLDAIKQAGSYDDPLTVTDVLALVEGDGLTRDSISPALSNMIKLVKHLHRRDVPNPEYGKRVDGRRAACKRHVKAYWYDEQYLNPIYGQKATVEREPAVRGPVARPRPLIDERPGLDVVQPWKKPDAVLDPPNAPWTPPGPAMPQPRNDAVGFFWDGLVSEDQFVTAIKIANAYVKQMEGKVTLEVEDGVLGASAVVTKRII